MKKYRRISFFATVLLILQITCTVSLQAAPISAQQEIRVGLTSLYSGKETLTINNTILGYGYCVGNTYLQEVQLESNTGFTFKPVSGYFVAEETIYSSYRAAKAAADAYRSFGVEAYPGSSYQCHWRVYFANSAKYSETEQLVQRIQSVTGKDKFEILSGSNYRIKMSGTFGDLLIDVDENYAYPQMHPLTADEKGICTVDMGTRSYRGRMEIGRYNKATLTAVNIVNLEEYLYGVVPAEMSSTWHEEALKAQAVCARSYALVKAGYGGKSDAKKGYKIVDTVSSQVYKGYLVESIKANRAVNATKGEMVCYNNKVVAAYYYSTSGGRTESSADVWAANLPYLQSVPDFFEQNAERMVWQELISYVEMETSLQRQGIYFDKINDLKVSKYSDTNRVYALNVVSDDRSLTLQGTTIRTVLNLFSTKFKIVRQGDVPDKVSMLSAEGIQTGRISDMYFASAEGTAKASETLSQYIVRSADNLSNYPGTAPENEDELLFAGMGYGHGVGMSQYGAKGMAEAGYNYKDIIEYYFTGAYVR